ncbi:MAG: DUF4835 family protein [Chitinophagaceae bacterium]|nr:MAG: DUF4835 family protein [Chitinophagaceae bacterium]
MLKRIIASAALILSCFTFVSAQELVARVSINSSAVGTSVDKKVFQSLQQAVTTFLNNRKWTEDATQQNEKINCNFLISIEEADNNVFKGTMIVQAARPVFNSSYVTPLINFQDRPIVFRYTEYQPIEFNENRVSGTDGLASNLTATLAYYVYIILGLDYNSFALRGGDPYFQKAQNIINNAPDGRDIVGWKAFDGQRNRYWLVENLTDSKYAILHDAMYNYYRLGLDNMYENEPNARAAVLDAITQLNTLNNDQQNSMIIPFFFQSKSTEIVKIFKKAPPEEKQRVQEMMSRLDIENANLYKQELK